MLQCAYYTYWRDLEVDGMQTTIRPDRGWAAIPTNDDLTLVVLGWPQAEASAYKSDVEANYLATLEMAPEFAERVRHATRVERFAGGPGAELLPQAVRAWLGARRRCRLHEGSDHGHGISDAFSQSGIASARDVGLGLRGQPGVRRGDERVPGRPRDAHAMPVFEFTTQMATLEPPPLELQELLGAIAGNEPAMDAFVSVFTGVTPANEFFDPANIGRLLAPAPA